MGTAVRNEPCPQCRENGNDASGDNLIVYSDDSCYCFACGYVEYSEEEKERRGIDAFEWDDVCEDMMSKEPITKAQIEQIKERTGVKGKGGGR